MFKTSVHTTEIDKPNKQLNMELTMINNAISQAKHKLARHRELGNQSQLSIVEVARLMDLVTFGPNLPQVNTMSLFFNYHAN